MSFLKKLTKEFEGLKTSFGGEDDKKKPQAGQQYGQQQYGQQSHEQHQYGQQQFGQPQQYGKFSILDH
jgi:hypothetical protein